MLSLRCATRSLMRIVGGWKEGRTRDLGCIGAAIKITTEILFGVADITVVEHQLHIPWTQVQLPVQELR